jgi:hypothetical protein
MILFGLVVAIMFGIASKDVLASSTPYYTFTTDNDQGFIKTSDAYTPKTQITKAGEDTFTRIEYVYVDSEDYIYVTDPGVAKVYIFDPDYNFVDEIYYEGTDDIPGFNAVNSVFVTEDKVYIPDSYAESIFIFDREAVLNRTPRYNLWFEDFEGEADPVLSTGDLFYLEGENGLPIGDPIYEIEVTGTDEDDNIIVDFKDYITKEVVFTKTEKVDFLGKFLGNWVDEEVNGTTYFRIIIQEEKNQPIQIITKPQAPVFQEGYMFAPQKVAVDTRGNMYIVGVQSSSGLIMLTPEGEFISFFGGNPLRTPIVDQLRSLMFSEKQKEELREQSEIFVDYISSVAIDEKGFVYTVTSTLEQNIIKKFNVSGKNYFNSEAIGFVGAVDLWVGNYGNVLVIEEYGWINEYNADGELVFTFNVKDDGINRAGLVNLPKSISADSNDNIYVADQGNRLIQIYEPTEFTNAIHTAFQAYQDGDEELAQEMWEYSLEYATVFDMAHEGLGSAYVRQERFEDALREYRLASYNPGISDTFWNVRQTWLEDNLQNVVVVVGLFFILRAIFKAINKRKHFTKPLEESFKKAKENSRVLRELLFITTFVKHPLDSFYEIKRRDKSSIKTASIIYLLLGTLYVAYQKLTNVIFIPNPNANVLYELIILSLILALWIIANYFVCLVRDGEGSFKSVYIATAYTLSPLLLVLPFVILISNVLTYQEAVFFNGPIIITFIWVTIYFFFMIKEIHNYEVGETFGIIFISMFTMLIMGIFLFVVYSINTQIFTVTEEIAREMIQR